jgi:hypothetical protein
MPYPLLCHPSRPCQTPLRLTVGITLTEAALRLRYRLVGPMNALRIPPLIARAGFGDGLWQHCCFELFASTVHSKAYREFNFSPSGQWAAYAFTDYRERCAWQPLAAPRIHVETDCETLEVLIELPQLLLPEAMQLQLGVSAVIESASGELTYWALNHAGARPDFHRRESFILELAANT